MAIISFDEFVKKAGGTPDMVKPVAQPSQPSSVLSQLGQQKPVESPLRSLTSKLADRGKTIVSEVTAKPARNIMAQEQGSPSGMANVLTRTTQAPIRVAGAVGGAVGDMVGAGLEATGLDEPIAKVLQPVVESDPVKKAVEVYKSLPQDTQEVLKAIMDSANIPLTVGASSLVKQGVESGLKATGEVLEAGVKAGSNVASKVLPTSEGIMQRVARIPKGEQAKFEKLTGKSVGQFLDETGNYGTPDKIVEKLYNDFQLSRNNADNALGELQGTYRATPVRTALHELEGKVERTSSPGAPDPELSRVKELVAKERKIGLTMKEINEVKRIYERRVRLDYLKTNIPEDVARATNVDSALREWQFKEADKAGLKNLGEINKSTQTNKMLMDALGKEISGSAGNNALGLTDAILLAGGSPESIASLVVKKTFSDPGLQSWAAKKLSKNKEKIGVPEAQFKEKLQLEAPKEGLPQSSNNIPVNLPKMSESTLEAELTRRFGKNYTKEDIKTLLLESGEGKPVFNTKPVNPLGSKSQSTADANLDAMNAKRAKLQSQEKLQSESSVNPTTKKKSSKGISGFINLDEIAKAKLEGTLLPLNSDESYMLQTEKAINGEKIQRIRQDTLDDENKAVAKALADNESIKEGNVYTFHKPSGIKAYGDDLGKYQITSARLKERSKQFLGRLVSDKEFLNSPKLQEDFIKAQIKWLRSKGLTSDEIIATHRHGFGKMTREDVDTAVEKRPEYVAKTKK